MMTTRMKASLEKSASTLSVTLADEKFQHMATTLQSEMDELTVHQPQIGLVIENMNRIATALERSHSVKAIPLIDVAYDECQLVLQQTGRPVGTIYYYDVEDMLEIDAEEEAAHLAEFLESRASKRPMG